MLKKSIYNEPLIPCHTLLRLASYLTLNVFTQLYELWILSFNRSRKILNFQKIVAFLILDGCLQSCRLVNVLKAHIR